VTEDKPDDQKNENQAENCRNISICLMLIKRRVRMPGPTISRIPMGTMPKETGMSQCKRRIGL